MKELILFTLTLKDNNMPKKVPNNSLVLYRFQFRVVLLDKSYQIYNVQQINKHKCRNHSLFSSECQEENPTQLQPMGAHSSYFNIL